MTTSYRAPEVTRFGATGTEPQRFWKNATILLSILSLALAFLLWQSNTQHSMMKHETIAAGAHYDHGFINMMIPHHQQAIDEGKRALSEAQHPELKQLAESIITSQQREIDQMKAWRKQWYGE